jgi:hypothetical protein
MTRPIRRHRTMLAVVLLAVLGAAALPSISSAAQALDTPRRGGVLLAVIGADPPA